MAKELARLVGPENVFTDPETLESHGADKWNARALPDVVVRAERTEDVAATLAWADQNGIPVTTRGGGIGYVGGCVPVRGGIVLALDGMNRILEVNPADGVAVVEAGVITGDLADAAAAVGWYYPPDPASLRECSIGGNIATNAGGPRCLKYGVTRAYVLGLEVVLADGRVLNAGGRVHKNKTGFDLVGLITGSEGLLGVVTKATVRLIPHPKARGMLAATFPEFPDAAACVETILNAGHLPSALEITDAFTLRAARAHLGTDALPEGSAHLIVETDGTEDAVAAELSDLRHLLESHGASGIDMAPDADGCERIWKLRREFSYALRATGMTKLNEDIVVPRSKLTELVRFCAEMEGATGIPVACFGHAGDGNIHSNLMLADAEDEECRARAAEALDRLFQWVLANGGAITGEHGVGMAKSRWFGDAVGETGLDIHRRLKAALDPNNTLNPGKFWQA